MRKQGETPFPGSSQAADYRPAQADLLCNRFQIISELDHGAQGTVYHVVDQSARRYAAKVANAERRGKELHENEVQVFHALAQGGRTPEGFPDIHFVGKHCNLGVICMDLLGHNLYRISHSEGFNVRTLFSFACEMLDRLQTLHDYGFIHRDVKPQNFVVDENGKVHLIDFALTTRYRDPKTNRHIFQRQEETFCGTLLYASLNAQRSMTQSRRDDLESLGYSIIEMMKGGLPWDQEDISEDMSDNDKDEHMAEMKEGISLKRLCEGLPKEIYEFMVEVTTMSYTQTPDYVSLRTLLKRKMISM